MKIFGYRGYSGEYPENTMLAFQKAIEAGAEGIQLDVHFSRDKKVVILHDDSLSRMTNGVGFVRHHNLKELKNYEIKGTYDGDRLRIPTLEEYFDWAKELPVVTGISIRNDRFYYPGLEEAVMNLVTEYKMVDKVILSTKKEASLELIKSQWPEVKVAWEIESGRTDLIDAAVGLKVDVLIAALPTLSLDFVNYANEKNIPIIAGPVNSLEELDRMEAYSIHGIQTMFLDMVKKALGMTQNPYSQELIDYAITSLQEKDDRPKKPTDHIKKQGKKLSGGGLGIIVGVIISISAAVIVTKIAMSFLGPLLS